MVKLLSFLMVLCVGAAHAAEPGPPEVVPEPEEPTPAEPNPTEPTPAEPPVDAPPPDPGLNTRWYQGPPRWFFSTLVDVGVLYLRPRLAVGWGRPHAQWVGVEANPIVSTDTVGVWGGIRLAGDWAELRAGGRFMNSLGRTPLVRKANYDREDIEIRTGDSATYAAFEAELSGAWDLGGGVDVFGETSLTYVTGVPEGMNVFEEVIKVVVEPPWIFRIRAGWTFDIGLNGALKLGPVAEAVQIGERGKIVLRAGIVARLKLYDDLEVRATIAPAFGGPDDLGLRGADAFILGIRWRWATGWSPKVLPPMPPAAE